jgi:hypothetical protein
MLSSSTESSRYTSATLSSSRPEALVLLSICGGGGRRLHVFVRLSINAISAITMGATSKGQNFKNVSWRSCLRLPLVVRLFNVSVDGFIECTCGIFAAVGAFEGKELVLGE